MLNTLRRLWKKWVHWYRYRDSPTVQVYVDVNDPACRRSFASLYYKSKEDYGEETIFLATICHHYNCEFVVEDADVCVLVFNDKRLYTMFMLKYSECL